MNRILIDIGSSTTKAYMYDAGQIHTISQRSISLKDDFDSKAGLSQDTQSKLFEYLALIQRDNPGVEMCLYGTAMFRKMSDKARVSFADELHSRLDLSCEVISQDMENMYLEMALTDKFFSKEPFLCINIGGGSTELVVKHEGRESERVNLDLGVGTLMTQFPHINDSVSGTPLSLLVKDLETRIPTPTAPTKVAFYTGGELTYMRLASYNVQPNTLFQDDDHPLMISRSDFEKRNNQIFSEVSLSELESLMPENPKWMHGARACSVIAQVICTQYGVETLIPSDSNLIHGIARKLSHTEGF